MEADGARLRTRRALGGPSPRGAGATPLAWSARRRGAALAAALALAACKPYVQGNGVYLEEDRTGSLPPFAGLHLEDGIQATVTAGGAKSVVVSGDANVVQYIRTEVRTETHRGVDVDVLWIRVDVPGGDFEVTIPPRAVVRTPEVRYLYAQDGASIDLRDAATEALEVEAYGDGEVLVRGPGGASLYATLDHAALDAGSYEVDYAEVTLTSGSRVELQADVTVTGSASGGSAVDNMLGTGVCDVTHDATSTVECRP